MKAPELRAEILRLRKRLDRLEPLEEAFATIADEISRRLEAPEVTISSY